MCGAESGRSQPRRQRHAGAGGAFVWAQPAANFGEIGLIAGAVFGLAATHLAFKYLTGRAEDKLTREKWRDYE
jgi:hypothetical protein